ncbi:MAG TPA: hypothetical protein GX525_09010 [Bacilli bacterium]|nr:hypothetical protein [Bacilli bacterium]
MKKVAWLLGALLLLVIAFSARNFQASVLLEAGPWWVYFILAGIIYSGYMAFKYYMEDRQLDEEFIEKEGEVFIHRMKEERQRNQAKRQFER